MRSAGGNRAWWRVQWLGWVRVSAVTVLVVAAVLATQATAFAATDLSDVGQDAVATRVGADASGTAFAVWSRFDGLNTIIQFRSIAEDGSLGAVTDLSAAGRNASSPEIAVEPGGTAHAVWVRFDGANQIVQYVRVDAGGSMGSVEDLSAPGQDAESPTIAVDQAGNAHVVWDRYDGANWIVQYGKVVGGTAGPVADLSAAGGSAIKAQVATDGGNGAHVVWERFDGANLIVQYVPVASDGTPGLVQDLSAAGRDAQDPQLAVDDDSTSHVAWYRFDGSNNIVQYRTVASDDSLGATLDLSAAGQDAQYPQIATDDTGTSHLVWARYDGARWVIQHGTVKAGTAGVVTDLSDSAQDAQSPELDVSASGVANAVWTRSDGANWIIQLRSATADGTLGTTVDLSAAGEDAYGQHISVAPDGRAHAVWLRYDGSNYILQYVGGPTLGASTSTIAFGNRDIDTGPANVRSVTVSADGGWDTESLAVALGGSGASSFQITSTTCGAALTTGSTCIVSTSFDPSRVGNRTAKVTITGYAANSPLVVALTGTGTTVNFCPEGTSAGVYCILRPGHRCGRIIRGTRRADVLIGTGCRDIIFGRGGADRIHGAGGNDTIVGGGGADVLFGGSGRDRLLGRAGIDWLAGGRGDDTLFGEGSGDNLFGGIGDDSLFGGDGNDSLFGGSGNDVLDGGAGSDFWMIGGPGSDLLYWESSVVPIPE